MDFIYNETGGVPYVIATNLGPKGDKGDTGSSRPIIFGAGVPSDSIGLEGDTYINTTNGDVYQKGASTWGSPTGNFSGPTTIDGLSDTEITGIAIDELLQWDGTDWVNHTLAEAGISEIGHTHVAANITDFDTEVSNNTTVVANTAKVTNATHTGDVTGSTELTIADDAVTYAKIQNVVANNVLLGNNAGAGGIVDELTASEVRTIINVEDGADVTDAANVNAAGAVMNTDTTTASMAFVVDEDNMSSNSNTKIPTQQSVKAYVDNNFTSTSAPIADHKLVRGDGGGNGVQETNITVDDSDNMTGVNCLKLNSTTCPSHSAGQLFYDSANDTLSFHNAEPDIALQIGTEQWLNARNISGSDIANGSLVYVSGADTNKPTIELAKADTTSATTKIIGIATHLIENNTNGFVTTFGTVRDLNTSTFSAGDILYLSASTAGAFTNVAPSYPNYILEIGSVTKVGTTDGEILLNVSGTPKDILTNFFNACLIEPIDFTVTSNGTVITGNLEQEGGGDVTISFSDGMHVHDCTPADPVTLTAGTDSSPTKQYVYIDQATKTLSVSTSYWPSIEHAKIAEVYLRSAATTQTEGAFINRNWNDHMAGTNKIGHMVHLGARLRKEHAVWDSGVAATATVNTTPTPDTVNIAVTSGHVWQAHRQTFPALDTAVSDDMHIVNHNTTPYLTVSDLNGQYIDAEGVSMNNRYGSFVLWGVQNRTGENSHLMINLPVGSYLSSANAIADASNYSVYTIPEEFRGVGFLIARFTFYMQSTGDSWTLEDTEDLRGVIPATVAGGASGSSGTSFSDNTFNIYNVTDSTKKVNFDVSAVTTATTRTISIPDSNETIGDASKIQGTTVDNTDIADGKVLKYNSVSGNIEWETESGSGGSITVRDIDGTPTISACTILQFTNGTVTDQGAGVAEVTISGAGTVAMDDLTDVTITSVAENDTIVRVGSAYVNRQPNHVTISAKGNQTGSYAIDLDGGVVQTITATGDLSLSATNATAGQSKLVTAIITASGADRTITFPAGWDWPNAPTGDQTVVTSGEDLYLTIMSNGTQIIAAEKELNETLNVSADSVIDGTTNGVLSLSLRSEIETVLDNLNEAYGVSWNGVTNEAPSKDAVYDKIESLTTSVEGTAVLSTGETGGSKYLREDGDGTCSWQAVPQGTVDTSGTPVANDFARFTDADTVEGRSYSETRSDLNVAFDVISGMIEEVSNKDYVLSLKMPYAGSITETTTKSVSGTCTATFYVNTTALGGTANSVSSTEQDQTHSSSNTFVTGDTLKMVVTANSLCTDMQFSVKIAR